jgi:hypothetical protein
VSISGALLVAARGSAVPSGAAFGYYLRSLGVHPVRRIPKILDLVMEPVAVSHMINLEGYTERTRVW